MQDKKKNQVNREIDPVNENPEITSSIIENDITDEPAESELGESETTSNEEIIAKHKKETEEYKDKYLRLVAEFDNFKRRSAKERMELIQTAGKEVISSLLEVMDDCDRAEKQMNNTDDILQIKDGIQLVFNKLRNTLQSKGVKAMESLDIDFDVEKHEAVTEIEVADKNKKGKVVDEIVKGYYLNDKLIRFAKVVVGK
jgi:molecular chaperone GrpE